MEFEKKTWKNRTSEYPARRTLTKNNGEMEIVTVSRNEGQVTNEGDAFNADNMNDMEDRIGNAFAGCQRKITYGTAEPSGGSDGDVYIQLLE